MTPLRILVITVSDRAADGVYEDRSGPAVEHVLREALPGCTVERLLVPDEVGLLRKALEEGMTHDAVLTTGGTGIGPRDITPETTEAFCERSVPGIAEYLRNESLRETPLAPLSRAYAGQRNRTLFVNLPGSVAGARSTARMVAPLLKHAVDMLSGAGH